MLKKIKGCQLEIDSERGVIYVHNPAGFTALRICGLEKFKKNLTENQIDLTIRKHSVGLGFDVFCSGSS